MAIIELVSLFLSGNLQMLKTDEAHINDLSSICLKLKRIDRMCPSDEL